MAITKELSAAERANVAARLQAMFGVDSNLISEDFTMDSWGDEVMVTITCKRLVSRADAAAILNALPLESEGQGA